MAELTFLGQSGVYLTDGSTRIVVDPYLSNNPFPGVDGAEIEADMIVVTHAHGDHWNDAVPLSRKGGVLISSVEIALYSASLGANTKSMNIGGTHRFEGGWLKFVPAWHSSAFPDGTYGGMPMGVVIELGGKRIYHAGDTALFSDMELIGQMGLDLALVPIGDNFTMGPEDALRSLTYLRPGRVVPIHYNTFPLIEQDGQEFACRASESGVEGVALDPGQSLTL